MIVKMAAALLADFILGDPVWLYHPIRVIGKWIHFLEKGLRKLFPPEPKWERVAGIWLVIFTILPAGLIPWGVLELASRIHPGLGWGLEVFWMYQILAMRSLKTESMKVAKALEKGNLKEGRKMLSWLVGRDTEHLSEEEVIQAAVETVSENTTDGVTAPLIFMAIGGAPLGFVYKAVNTLDSMVGYRNDRYRYFGTASARLDDLLNFIPARLSGCLMVLSAFISGYNGRGAWKTFCRDRNKHLSPNSAQTESACAGALGIQLGGTHHYFGRAVEKPTLGEDLRKPEPTDIQRANRLMFWTGGLCFGLLEVILMIINAGR